MDFLVDIGNVLLPFDFVPSFRRLMPGGSGDAGAVFARLIERKDDFESGKMSVDDYVTWASGQLGFDGSRQEFIDAWCDIFTVNEPMWQLVESLKSAGHRLIIFSNTNGLHAPYVLERYPGFSLFDACIFSHEVGAIKPEQKIFDHALETYQLVPEETYYIDDLLPNIEAGQQNGFHCHHYSAEAHEALLDDLGQKGVL